MKDLRNLPDPVIERLSHLDAVDRRAFEVTQRGNLLEARSSTIETRTNDDGTVGVHGYATVYEYPYAVAGGPPWGWTETIAEGACRKSVMERDDVRCLFDHEGIPVARTKSRTMTLESDTTGLLMDAPTLDLPRSPLVQSLHSALDRGDLDEMSFAFRVLRQEWNDDYTERRILEVQLFDVSIVTYPANPATVVALRADTPAPATVRGMDLATARAVADASRLAVV